MKLLRGYWVHWLSSHYHWIHHPHRISLLIDNQKEHHILNDFRNLSVNLFNGKNRMEFVRESIWNMRIVGTCFAVLQYFRKRISHSHGIFGAIVRGAIKKISFIQQCRKFIFKLNDSTLQNTNKYITNIKKPNLLWHVQFKVCNGKISHFDFF